jgi:hypothetical protein
VEEKTVKKSTAGLLIAQMALLGLAILFILSPGFAEENNGQKASQ